MKVRKQGEMLQERTASSSSSSSSSSEKPLTFSLLITVTSRSDVTEPTNHQPKSCLSLYPPLHPSLFSLFSIPLSAKYSRGLREGGGERGGRSRSVFISCIFPCVHTWVRAWFAPHDTQQSASLLPPPSCRRTTNGLSSLTYFTRRTGRRRRRLYYTILYGGGREGLSLFSFSSFCSPFSDPRATTTTTTTTLPRRERGGLKHPKEAKGKLGHWGEGGGEGEGGRHE